MAVDEAILKAVSAGDSRPTLRFYTWTPSAVSVGYFQKSMEVDIQACRELGIDIVRRLTGGRAVLHDRELTYSLICPEGDPHFPDNISGTYKVISSCLIRGLNSLGIDAMLTPSVRPSYRTPSPSSPPVKGGEINNSPLPWRERVRVREKTAPSACFSSPSHYEITLDGKKLIGSAQKREKGAFLQHGSILLGFDRTKLERVLPGSGRLDMVAAVWEHKAVEMEDLVSALVKGFEDFLGISFSDGRLSPGETALVKRYKEERYSRQEWNLGKAPVRI